LGENEVITSLESKKIINEKINHYTIYTENTNAYYANGLLSGNFFSNLFPSWLRRLGVNTYMFLVLGGKGK
jgi:hypothetical protein